MFWGLVLGDRWFKGNKKWRHKCEGNEVGLDL